MKLPFTKMHGTGNDFVVIDVRRDTLPENPFASVPAGAELARHLADRRFGVGADQILLLADSDHADFRMGIFNADGSEVEMCGNGIRCLAHYVWRHGLSRKDVLKIETPAGIIRPRRDGDQVAVDMGEPVLEATGIPVRLEGDRVIDHPLDLGDETFRLTCVSMGNPHAVLFVDDVEQAPVRALGPRIEMHDFFPNRTNVEFVQVSGRGALKMRVWERGSGETWACGTGACAAAVAAVLTDRADRDVTVELQGGDLRIAWRKSDDRVIMTGPATEVFQGDWLT